MVALSLSLSLQYSSISDLGREIETHDARTLIVPLLVSLHASYLRIQMISPSLPLLRGGFFREGRKGGEVELTLLATLSFRMKKSGWNIELSPLFLSTSVA